MCVDSDIQQLIPVLLPGVEKLPTEIGLTGRRSIRFIERVDEYRALNQLVTAVKAERTPAQMELAFDRTAVRPSPSPSCFIAASWHRPRLVFDAIMSAARAASLSIIQMVDAREIGFCCDVHKGVLSAEIVVADCASRGDECRDHGELWHQVGVANGLGKPLIVLAEDFHRFPLTITASAVVECSPADFDPPDDFVRRLSTQLRAVLERSEAYNRRADAIPDTIRRISDVTSEHAWGFQVVSYFATDVAWQFTTLSKHLSQLQHAIVWLRRSLVGSGEPGKAEEDIRRLFSTLDELRKSHREAEEYVFRRMDDSESSVAGALANSRSYLMKSGRDSLDKFSRAYVRLRHDIDAYLGCYVDVCHLLEEEDVTAPRIVSALSVRVSALASLADTVLGQANDLASLMMNVLLSSET
jgi:hypothetical protein